ncbi:MAG: hypothetical protein AAFO86_06910, partial [Pseudomonadota bacterium]
RSIEVRVSLSDKQSFAARAATRGESMSTALRRLIAEDAVPPTQIMEAPMWRKFIIAGLPAAITVGVLVAVSLGGAQARTDFKGNFRAMDHNRDGYVDRTEMIEVMSQRIAKAHVPDVCDGTEWARKWSLSAEILADGEIAFADGNHDGKLTLLETVASIERKRADDFLQADVDASGYVTLAEMEDAYRADEVMVSAPCRAAIGMQRAEQAGEIILFLDSDQDGRVSLREFVDH